ncbi:hypothetical protein RHMOL_Rhmol01G0313200 [Rhododendron molle]|uniref:Uncharacterized protein n=1 Tax=Rhododendron molle TaxID=49168 RepID=A0ACC0Q8Y3_RHOML|nr:hypothetical protein RHMOL_Rhmol01G0313200 [Rhododendron molle]
MTSTPVSVYFLILLYACLNPPAMAVDENEFAYKGFNGANISLEGVAKIHSNGLLQLTNFSKHQIGRAFYKHPIRFDTSSSTSPQALSFSTHFVFAIVPETRDQSSDGMAFAISPSMDFNQAVGNQYFGLFNSSNNLLPSNHLLAIELDTQMNPELKDINDNHVGIDVNSLLSNVSAPVTYYSNTERTNRSLELVSGIPFHVWIEYDGLENVLNVTLAPFTSPKPDQSLMSTYINLSSILLDSNSMYVGFSTATGPISGNHYILGWSFNKSGKAQDLDSSELPSLPQRKPRLKTGVEIAVSVTTVFIGLTIIIAGIYYMLRRKKYEEIQGAILETSDPRLGGDFLGEEMELVLKLGLFCSKSDAETRPSMRQVMQYIDGDVLLPEIIHDSTSIGTIGPRNESSLEFVTSFPSSIVKSSALSISSTESMLTSGG